MTAPDVGTVITLAGAEEMNGMTITEFLTARLDEWEQAARAAGGDDWEQGTRHHEKNVVRPAGEFDWVGITGTPVLTAQVANTPRNLFEARAAHIARHDPARVLAQVTAMRAIVGEYERLDRESDKSDGLADLAARVAAAAAARDAVRHLATTWSSHPDYDPAWAPEGE